MNARDLEIFLRGLHVGIQLAEGSKGDSKEGEIVRRVRGKGKKSREERWKNHSEMMKKAWETRRKRKLEEEAIKEEEVANFGPKE